MTPDKYTHSLIYLMGQMSIISLSKCQAIRFLLSKMFSLVRLSESMDAEWELMGLCNDAVLMCVGL